MTHLLQNKNTQLKSKIGKLEQLLQTRQKELQRIQQVKERDVKTEPHTSHALLFFIFYVSHFKHKVCEGTEEAIKATNIQPLENLQQLIHSQVKFFH